MTPSVLFLSHNGLTEPLGRRQVLPYLVGLCARGWRFTVVSFEKDATATPGEVSAVENAIGHSAIEWRPLRYHRRPPLLATAYDVLQGIQSGRRLDDRPALIHARSTVPALMARQISRGIGNPCPWIFDLRGLIAEEYVDAGHWRRGGLRHRVTNAVERRLVEQAYGLVTLTHRIAGRLPPSGGCNAGRPATVIPCCVDLDVFRPSESRRQEVRHELGLGEDPVLVYSGSLGSWYRLAEIVDFFAEAAQAAPGLRLLLLTPHKERAMSLTHDRGLASRVIVRTLTPDAVPRYLSAADAGICFLGRHRSKEASSPTKYGEYLASGLPVITNGWIGDASRLAGETCWLLVDDFTREAYGKTTARLAELLAQPESTRAAARALAQREFALETAVDRYDALYRRVLQ